MKNLFIVFILSGILLFGCTQPQATIDGVQSSPSLSTTATIAASAINTAAPTESQIPVKPTQTIVQSEPTATIESTETASVQEFSLTASQFKFEPATLTVKKGVPVKLTITSLDVEHGFTISEFNVNQNLKPGQTQVVEFTPDKAGEFSFFCSLFCGSGHGSMRGKLVVID